MKKSELLSLTILLIMLPTAVALAQSTTASQLQAALDEWRESFEIPGAVLAIDIPDQETLILVSGVSDLEAGMPLVSHDRFHIGSITKTFEVERETILNKTLSGHWKGDGKIIVAWCERTHLSFDLHIDEYGNVTGTIGDATIDHGHIRRNNKILRLLGNSEYIIEATLSNVLIKEEYIQRDSIRIFLHFKSPFLTGGFHTSGSKFGGKETMVLSGTDIRLSKMTMKIDE